MVQRDASHSDAWSCPRSTEILSSKETVLEAKHACLFLPNLTLSLEKAQAGPAAGREGGPLNRGGRGRRSGIWSRVARWYRKKTRGSTVNHQLDSSSRWPSLRSSYAEFDEGFGQHSDTRSGCPPRRCRRQRLPRRTYSQAAMDRRLRG